MADVGLSRPPRKVVTYGRRSRTLKSPRRNDGTSAPLGTQKIASLDSTKSWAPGATPGKLPARSLKPTTTKDLGVFDVPSSDNETSPPKVSVKKSVQRSIKRKTPEVDDDIRSQDSPGDATSAESSDGSRKRKRITPSEQLQGELEAAAQKPQSNAKASMANSLASKRAPASTANQRTKARSLVKKSAESKRKNTQTPMNSRSKTRAPSKLSQSASAPAMLESMLGNVAETTLQVQNPTDSAFAQIAKDKSPPTYDAMDLELTPSTPPSRAADDSSTPSQMLLNTPRQSRLWDNLLKENEGQQLENEQPGNKLLRNRYSTSRKTSKANGPATSWSQSTATSNSIPPPRRHKLVESLIGGRPALEEISSEDDEQSDDDQSDIEDTIMRDHSGFQTSADVEGDKPVHTEVFARRTGMTHVGGPRITYGEKRSFLSAPQTDFDQILDAPLDDIGASSQGQRSITHTQSSFTQKFEDTIEEDSLEEEGPSMRSAHELQALGSNRRFVDKLDALLDDVNGSDRASRSAQRSALMELVEKMMAKDFLMRFLQLDYDQKLFLGFSGSLDPIADFLWTAMVAITVNGGATAHVLERMCKANLVGSLIRQLVAVNSLAAISKERKTNMSKVAREDLMKFGDSLCQETLWGSRIPRTLSPRLMALKSLDLLIRKSRESGNMEAILDDEQVAKLVSICREVVEKADGPDQSPDRTIEAELALSILESDSIHLASPTGANNWSSKALGDLADSTTAMLGLSEANGGTIESLLLRLCLNLTNNNGKVCEIFGNSDILAALATSVTTKFAEPLDQLPEELRASLLDRLILCLGTLINLAEFSEKARMSLVANGDGLIRGLLDAFAVGLKRSIEVCRQACDTASLLPANHSTGRVDRADADQCRIWLSRGVSR